MMNSYGVQVCLYSVRLRNLFRVLCLKTLPAMSAPSAPTMEQMDVLFNFLEEHRDLARGLLRNVEGRLQSQRLWDEICTTLNSMGGCTKTVQQWQRVWTDKKYLAKKNVAAARRSASATGGGPSTAPQLSRMDLRVVAIMGDGFGEPQTSARVPAFVEESAPSSQEAISASGREPEFQVHVINEPEQPSDNRGTENTPLQPSRNEPLPNEPTQRSATARRRRVRAYEDSVTRRFFALEERRLQQQAEWANEFAGIRAALTQLTNTIQGAFAELCELMTNIVQHQQHR